MGSEEARERREQKKREKEQVKALRKQKGTRGAHAAANVFAVLAVVMVIAAAVLTILPKLMENDEGIGITTEIPTEEETAAVSTAQLIYADKSDLDLDDLLDGNTDEFDEHGYIVYCTAALQDAYDAGYPWASILFEDGTGIMFPDADINEAAIYGEMDADGNITQQYGTITVTGTNVDYLARSEDDLMSDDALALIGNEYYNDSTYAEVSELTDGYRLITIIVTTADDEEETAEIIIGRMQELDPYIISITVNDTSYMWMEETGLIDMSDSDAVNTLSEGIYAQMFPDETEETEIDLESIDGISDSEWEAMLEEYEKYYNSTSTEE